MRIAIYQPWVYLKSGLERTLLEIVRRSRHEWVIHTSHYDRGGTYPELADVPIVELPGVSVRRTYGTVLRGALRMATTRIDLGSYDALVISCEGLGDLLTLRNSRRPTLCLCHTPLRASFDPAYRQRLLNRAGPLRWPVLALDAGFRALDRFCWSRYDGVVAVSENVRQRIAAGQLYPPETVQVLHPGIDAGSIAVSAVAEPFFLVAGRIMWTKNVELAIEAFACARARLPAGYRLVVAGMVDAKSRGYFARLQARAEEVGGIRFVENPSDHAMRRLYERCAALLFTPFNEDWGMTPVEAMAAGKPVIAVDAGGPRESVVHGQTGYLAPDDPGAFAQWMVELAADPLLARRLGEAGAERAHLFTWDIFVNGIDAAAERVVAAGAMAAAEPQSAVAPISSVGWSRVRP